MKKIKLAACAVALASLITVSSAAANGQWYDEYVRYWGNKGIIATDTYEPMAHMTRLELVRFLALSVGAEKDFANADDKALPFIDVQKDDEGYDCILWAYKNKIINGREKTIFDGSGTVQRQELITVLWRFAENRAIAIKADKAAPAFKDAEYIAPYAAENIYFFQKAGFIQGVGNGYFLPESPVENAEAAKLIYLLTTYKA